MVVWNTWRAPKKQVVRPTMSLIKVFSGSSDDEIQRMTESEYGACGFAMSRALLRLADREVGWALKTLEWDGKDHNSRPSEDEAWDSMSEPLGLQEFSELEMTEWLEEVSKDPEIVQ